MSFKREFSEGDYTLAFHQSEVVTSELVDEGSVEYGIDIWDVGACTTDVVRQVGSF